MCGRTWLELDARHIRNCELGLEILLSVVIVRSDHVSPDTTRRRQSAVSWAGAETGDLRPETVHKTAKTWEI